MEAIPQMKIYANKNEHTKSLKQVMLLGKEFGFTSEILKGLLAKERNHEFFSKD